jgi:tyrosyl-tRNA synthetase
VPLQPRLRAAGAGSGWPRIGAVAKTAQSTLLDDLVWRGLVADVANRERLEELAADGGSVYCGFDPTADSLHVGNLVPLLGLRRFQLAGMRPIALAGGGTGLIGDPSGRSSERALNDADTVAAWTERIRPQMARFVDFDAGGELVDNYEWLSRLSAIDLLRDVGKHFPLGWMLGKESVRARIEAGGLSYTEFSYMVLQAYDFLHLSRSRDCLAQVGGSDQFGNITAGVELIRRVDGRTAAALTFPLLTRASGEKFGKTAAGAVWLDPQRTTPFAFYQFWLNTDDRDVPRYLRTFTFLDREQIEELDRATREEPHRREGQRRLAQEMTDLVHGVAERERAEELTDALFGRGRLTDVDPGRLERALDQAPSTSVAAHGETPSFAALLVATGLAASMSEANRLIASGGVYANDERVSDGSAAPQERHFLGGRVLVLRRGRRTHGLVLRG